VTGAGRDRDPQDRPRNARPRDELGRPLPYGAAGVDRQPEGVVRTADETLTEARRLLAEGRPFHAHEVFEDAWKAAQAEDDRTLWRGLAQLAVGLTHVARGNPRGAATLLERAADTLERLQTAQQHGLDVAQITMWSRGAAATVRTNPRAIIAPPPLGASL
jgi:hypothetical protein